MNEITIKKSGNGKNLVLMHGFCASAEIWAGLACELEKNFTLLTVEFPGHGNNFSPVSSFTLPELALSLREVLQKNGVEKYSLVGHSLGGYVGLALAEIDEKNVENILLFHSNIFADSAEKQAERDKAADFIRNNGAELFLSMFVPKWFAPQNIGMYSADIQNIIKSASRHSGEVFVQYLSAMKQRKDYETWVKNTKIPVHFIAGRDDQAIPFVISSKQMQIARFSKSLILDNVGHAGMYEAREKTANFIASL